MAASDFNGSTLNQIDPWFGRKQVSFCIYWYDRTLVLLYLKLAKNTVSTKNTKKYVLAKKNFLVSFRQWKMCELYTPIFRAVFVQPKLARQKKSETTPPPTTVLTRETHLNTDHPLNSPCIEQNTHALYLIIKNDSSIKRNSFVINIYIELYKVILAPFGLILVVLVLFGHLTIYRNK